MMMVDQQQISRSVTTLKSHGRRLGYYHLLDGNMQGYALPLIGQNLVTYIGYRL